MIPDRDHRDESGHSVLAVLVVFALLLTFGFSLLTTTTSDFQSSGAWRDMTEARYLAEAGLEDVVAMQNDLSRSPRYLFDVDTYDGGGADPTLPDHAILDPETGAPLGTVSRRLVGGKDPLLDNPPYVLRSTAVTRGARRTIEAAIAPVSLLEYALWTENSVSIAPYITYTGKVYSASFIDLTGAPITFRRKVEYVTTINNPSFATYEQGKVKLKASKPSVTSLADLAFYERSAREVNVCGEGYGLYVTTGMPYTNLFKRSTGIYHIDLTLFDFSGPLKDPPEAIRYMGQALVRYDAPTQPLSSFNGIIYVNGTLNIWGINGGRSVEDVAWTDDLTGNPSAKRYPGPYGTGKNQYSNNRLDAGEDGSNGGQTNGVLDPLGRGRSLTIVTPTGKDIWIDHNIFMGIDPLGVPVRTALIAGRGIHVASNSPKTLVMHAALMALGASTCSGSTSGGYSWYPCGDHAEHADNWWARVPGTSPAQYTYDTDHDETLEGNNGASWSYDRNENSMLTAWSLQVLGNRIFKDRPSSGHWASDAHLRFYTYDDTLVIYEPPCYPVLPEYDLVAGSVVEVR